MSEPKNLHKNIDPEVVRGFGDEWSRFTYINLNEKVLEQMFSDYFSLLDWSRLPPKAVCADLGCGSGRWSKFVAQRVGHLILVDASPEALEVAKINLKNFTNVSFINSSIEDLPIENESLDFAFCLGVLHRMPNPAAGIDSIAAKLKKGAPCLIYVYYAFDNRCFIYQILWGCSDWIRRLVSRLPYILRFFISQIISIFIYWPLARMALLLDYLRLLPDSWPLAYYRDKPFYVMRNDALDRFETKLEHRFSRFEINEMLTNAGFNNIRFSDRPPYWCTLAIKS
ncbi:class I SAM-dependent methyltransferase [Parathermosynechococcus lividus]|uniref:class I SAM-dependent methyltransferase n=1 Tax=Parathermosynechococcus lividus TaxID=33070 RepID=UPI000C193C23|nr:class I SAM-dependent methyltransferase [Thermostichus lividus]